MNVRIVYRNYKILHDLYGSLVSNPPDGVHYTLPSVISLNPWLYQIYNRFGDTKIIRFLINNLQDYIFTVKETGEEDLLHYAQMIKFPLPEKKFIVDFEHIISLANFSKIDKNINRKIYNFLSSEKCCKILPFSEAAEETLFQLFGKNDDILNKKIQVVYPALPNYFAKYKGNCDFTIVRKSNDAFNLLFVGNNPYKKGLHEILEATKKLHSEKKTNINLYVISDAPKSMVDPYTQYNVKLYPPQFSKTDIIKKFYMPCDLFVLPTHDDTFGMAILYSLASKTPVLTTKQFASPEIVRDSFNGYLLNSKWLHLDDVKFPNRETTKKYHGKKTIDTILVDDIVDKVLKIIKNKSDLEGMGNRALSDFDKNGKFSISTRNSKMLRIYKNAL